MTTNPMPDTMTPDMSKAAERLAVLREIEWIAGSAIHQCPMCLGFEDDDLHRSDCSLGRLIRYEQERVEREAQPFDAPQRVRQILYDHGCNVDAARAILADPDLRAAMGATQVPDDLRALSEKQDASAGEVINHQSGASVTQPSNETDKPAAVTVSDEAVEAAWQTFPTLANRGLIAIITRDGLRAALETFAATMGAEQEAEIARLRAALEPFANPPLYVFNVNARYVLSPQPEDWIGGGWFSTDDFRKARAALSAGGGT